LAQNANPIIPLIFDKTVLILLYDLPKSCLIPSLNNKRIRFAHINKLRTKINREQVMVYQYVREPLRNEEADQLCQVCETPQEKLIIWTLLDTGLRVSELCSLTPQQVLWQQRSLRITGKGGPHGKKSKKRVVPMSKRVQTLLEHYFALHNRWPVGPRQVQKIVKQIANRAKVSQDVTPHILRHTFATLALQKGISLAAVQKILGHDRLTTTAIYLNLTDAHVVEEYSSKW
jgi:integrase/recombinase XerD